ncbi:MAG: nicotinate-nucleotide adenylyltransferase [Lachnospiraceae bacterium]
MRIGMMGGTFDPIHNGHLLIAENARVQYRLDRVFFIPAGAPPHKLKKGILPGDIRYEMIRLAIHQNPGFELSTYELDRDCISYSYETVTHFQDCYPNDQLYFILGADSLKDMEKWKYPKEIFSRCIVLAAVRDQFEKEELENFSAKLNCQFSSDIRTIQTPLFQVSSGEIRTRIKQGASIRYLVPDEVDRYIQHNHLYR